MKRSVLRRMAEVAANHFKNLLNLTKQYSASAKAVKELRPVLNNLGNDKKASKMWKRGVCLPGLLLVCAYVYVWVFAERTLRQQAGTWISKAKTRGTEASERVKSNRIKQQQMLQIVSILKRNRQHSNPPPFSSSSSSSFGSSSSSSSASDPSSPSSSSSSSSAAPSSAHNKSIFAFVVDLSNVMKPNEFFGQGKIGLVVDLRLVSNKKDEVGTLFVVPFCCTFLNSVA